MKRKLTVKGEEQLKAKSRILSIKEGAAYSVSDGSGFRYITPYALLLGANNTHIGLLSALPTLLGNVAQIPAIMGMGPHRRKSIVFWGTVMQAFSWLLLIGLGFAFFAFKEMAVITPAMLIIIYSCLVAFGGATVPVWVSWMKDLVPKEIYGRYFGMRNRIVGTVAIVSMLIAGFILDYFKQTKVFMGFAIIFFIAFIARFISAMIFRKQYEPKLNVDKKGYFTIWQFVRNMYYNNFGRFTLYVSLLIFATAIASPFFAVYMLTKLHFSYVFFTIVMMSAPVSTLIFMPAWGKFSDKYGNLRVMKICGFLIPLVPLLWCGSFFLTGQSSHILLPYLIAIESFSGFAWAGFNLAYSNYIFDAVTKERLAVCDAYFNIFYGAGNFCGALLGGLIASTHFAFFGIGAMLFVFLLSAVARLAASAAMLPKLKEVRPVKRFGLREARDKILALTPSQALKYLDISIVRLKP